MTTGASRDIVANEDSSLSSRLPWRGNVYERRVVRVIDGDTIRVAIGICAVLIRLRRSGILEMKKDKRRSVCRAAG